MITILLQKILTSLTSLLTGLVTSLTAIDEALDVPVIVKTVTGAVCNFTANIARRCYSVKTTISASGGGGTPSEPIAIVGSDSVSVFQSGSNTSQYIESVIEFDDTCYGGEIDVISGKMKVTHGITTLDGTEQWTQSGAAFRTYQALPSADTTAGRKPVICNIGTYLSAGTTENACWLASGYFYFCPPSSVTSEAEMAQWVSDHNIQACYPIDEPVINDISHINITPVIGENNIWFDSGNDTTVIYYEKLED